MLLATPAAVSASDSIDPDTLLSGDIDEAEMQRRDSLRQSHRNTAEGLNAMQYVMNDGYKVNDDSFRRWFEDHIFVMGGLGAERIRPRGNTKYDMLMTANLGVGKQLSRHSTVRLLLDGAYGFQRYTDSKFYKLNPKADFLFNFSDYFNGYNPARTLSIQGIIGAGANWSHASTGRSMWSPEVHVGAQLSLYCGPQASLVLEPYIGIGGDRMDLAGDENWRDFDYYFGARVSFVYYILSNYSKEAKARFMDNRYYSNWQTDDYSVHSWQMPWFVEFSDGAFFNYDSRVGMGRSVGNDWNIAVGKWISPAVGFKLGAFSRSNIWMTDSHKGLTGTDYERHWHGQTSGGRFDFLINPLGINPNYKFGKQFTFYVLFGTEFGQINRYYPGGKMSRRIHGYEAGLHGAYRLSPDLQLFIEPRWVYDMWSMPTGTKNVSQRCNERGAVVDLGITMLLRSKSYRRQVQRDDLFDREARGLFISILGGLPLLQTKSPVYPYGVPKGYEWGAEAEWHFNHYHGVRLQFERFAQEYRSDDGRTHTLRANLLSPGYQANLTSVFSGLTPGRYWDLYAFAGPTFAPGSGGNIRGGAHLGFKVDFKFSHDFSATLSPTLYCLNGMKTTDGFALPQMKIFKRMSFFQTINLGIKWRLPWL